MNTIMEKKELYKAQFEANAPMRVDSIRIEHHADQEDSIGIVAVAEVSYPIGGGSRRIEWFSSSGLWGIESDSSEEYLTEVEKEELADLKDHLTHFGVNHFPKFQA